MERVPRKEIVILPSTKLTLDDIKDVRELLLGQKKRNRIIRFEVEGYHNFDPFDEVKELIIKKKGCVSTLTMEAQQPKITLMLRKDKAVLELSDADDPDQIWVKREIEALFNDKASRVSKWLKAPYLHLVPAILLLITWQFTVSEGILATINNPEITSLVPFLLLVSLLILSIIWLSMAFTKYSRVYIDKEKSQNIFQKKFDDIIVEVTIGLIFLFVGIILT